MNISLAHIMDALSSYTVYFTADESMLEVPYNGIELTVGQPHEDGILYIEDMEYRDARGQKHDKYLRIVTNQLAVNQHLTKEELLRIEGITAADAFNAIIRFVLKFETCVNNLRLAYYHQRDMQAFCQLLSDFVGNPVVVYDEDVLPYAQAGFTPEQINYQYAHQDKRIPYMLRAADDWRVIGPKDYLKSTEPYRFVSRRDSIETLMCNAIHDHHLYGILEIFQLNKQATHADVNILEQACKILATPAPDTPPKIVLDILRGDNIQEEFINTWRASLHWKPEDKVYIIVPYFSELYGEHESARHTFMAILKSFLPDAAFGTLNETWFAIVNNRVSERTATLKKLEGELNRVNASVCLGSSELIVAVESLRENFEHAKFAANYAYGVAKTKSFIFDDCRFAYLMDICQLDKRSKLLIDMRVAAMYQDDVRMSSQNTLTVLTFIESGFRLNNTAEALFVHRNTIVYRLKSIRDRYGLDLLDPVHEPDFVFQVLLSAKLLTTANHVQ